METLYGVGATPKVHLFTWVSFLHSFGVTMTPHFLQCKSMFYWGYSIYVAPIYVVQRREIQPLKWGFVNSSVIRIPSIKNNSLVMSLMVELHFLVPIPRCNTHLAQATRRLLYEVLLPHSLHSSFDWIFILAAANR